MKMTSTSAGGEKKRSRKVSTTINSLDHDILCIVFSYLGFFDLARCSAVCKFWNAVINRSTLLQSLYLKCQQDSSGSSSSSNSLEKPLRLYLQEQAIEHHRSSLQEGSVYIDQWRGHSVRAEQCRMRMGYILTGVGEKVMRLWSVDGYKFMEEYSVPGATPLIDYDFDENKIVGLVGTRICIWRRNGSRSIFPQHEGTFNKGLCMRYFDPEAVVGCEDGTARVFDMYSKKCSRIIRDKYFLNQFYQLRGSGAWLFLDHIRTNAGPLSCLTLGENQLLVTGSLRGGITISDLSSDERIATLSSTIPTGISTLCFNHCSHLVFTGSTSGYASCWDLRKMRAVWETRASPNVVYSVQHMQNDTSTLVVGGIDGILRMLDQNTGEVLSCCVMESEGSRSATASRHTFGHIERKRGRRISKDTRTIDSLCRSTRPPITSLAVGMEKVVTMHGGKHIRVWKFNT